MAFNLSLYIHIPFCKARCRYCDFVSRPELSPREIDPYLNAVIGEWRRVSRTLPPDTILTTIYTGGGTPSLIAPDQWEEFVSELFRETRVEPDAEWTVECNPDSFSEEKARTWLRSGVNRLSVGVQSCNDRILRLLGRIHTRGMALETLDTAATLGFSSLSADIIFGIPLQSRELLEATLTELLSREAVMHLSAYELTLAHRSPLGRHPRLLPLPHEQERIAQHRIVLETCRRFGHQRYEVSNFARSGHECRHNMACWRYRPYVGLGAAAHSFVNGERSANIDDVDGYIEKIYHGTSPRMFSERLTPQQAATEILMLGLRTAEGMDPAFWEERTGLRFFTVARRRFLADLRKEGLVVEGNARIRLTDTGMLMADGIARRMSATE